MRHFFLAHGTGTDRTLYYFLFPIGRFVQTEQRVQGRTKSLLRYVPRRLPSDILYTRPLGVVSKVVSKLGIIADRSCGLTGERKYGLFPSFTSSDKSI